MISTNAIPDSGEWVDDSVLRTLAREYHEGLTDWILAADMAEFYGKLDCLNACRNNTPLLRVQLRREESDRLKAWNRKEKAGPQLIRDSDLRMEIAGKKVRIFYSATPDGKSIFIEAPRGWVPLNFGSGHNEFAHSFRASSLPEARIALP